MRGAASLLVAACVVGTLGGCVRRSDLMTTANQDVHSVRPDPGRSLVVFLRPSRYGGAVQAAIYDGERLVGISSSHTAIAYQASPGPHTFMVVSEAADFLGADLLPDRTYYALVVARTGAWRARFSLRPVDARTESHLAGWRRDVHLVAMNDQARRWDEANRASVEHKRSAYMRKWLEKPETSRPMLRPQDGV